MDRSAFLGSLPFLIPLQSTSWPPAQQSNKILLGDDSYSSTFFLSIEPVQTRTNDNSNTNTTARPAFFAVTQQNQDPSLAPIQIAVAEFNDSGLDSSPTAAKDDYSMSSGRNTGAVVYMRVENAVYAMDLKQLCDIRVAPEIYERDDDDEGDDDAYSRRKVSRPASLVLQFDGVHFRILNTSLDDFRDDKDTLNSVCQTIKEVSPQQMPFPLPHASPCRLSVGSSSSTTNGQREATVRDETTITAADDDDDDSRANKKRTIDEGIVTTSPVRMIQRHRAVFDECLSSLTTIKQVLDTPVTAIALGDDSTLSLTPLLTRTTELQSASYLSSSEMTAAREHYDSTIRDNEQKIENVLNSFFPAPNRGKQVAKQVAPSGAEAAEQACTELMEERKRITRERHKLSLLPTRG